MSSRYCSGKAMSSSSFGFCETPMPSVSFCLPTPFGCLYLFTYRSRPMQTNKKIDDFFFACGCRAGILFDFQMIIERGPEIFTGEPGEIIVDSLQSPVMLTAKKHIQYFYHQTILDSNVGQGRRRGGNGVLFLRCCPSGSCLNPVDEWTVTATVHPSVKFVTFLFRNPSHDDIMKNGLLAMWPGRITEKVPYGGNDDAELEES